MWAVNEGRTHLTKESHSEVGAEQPLARVHDLRHFTVRAMQRVVQAGQFLTGPQERLPYTVDAGSTGQMTTKERTFAPRSLCAAHKWGWWACRCPRWARTSRLSTARLHTPLEVPSGHPESTRGTDSRQLLAFLGTQPSQKQLLESQSHVYS